MKNKYKKEIINDKVIKYTIKGVINKYKKRMIKE